MFSYSTQRTMALEFVLQGLMAWLLAIHCACFQICEMGTRLGWVGITGHLETGLSGQPEVLSGHLPAGVRGRHRGGQSHPSIPFRCWWRRKEPIPGGSWVSWGPSGQRGYSYSQAPQPRHCSPYLTLGGAGEKSVGDPPLLHPGMYIFKGKAARSGRASAHVTASFFPSPPSHPLGSFLQLPGQLGVGWGGVLKIHLRPPNVRASSPLDLGGRSWRNLWGPGARGRGPLSVGQDLGGLKFVVIAIMGFVRPGGERLSFLARALFFPRFFESWML